MIELTTKILACLDVNSFQKNLDVLIEEGYKPIYDTFHVTQSPQGPQYTILLDKTEKGMNHKGGDA